MESNAVSQDVLLNDHGFPLVIVPVKPDNHQTHVISAGQCQKCGLVNRLEQQYPFCAGQALHLPV